jgi:hypothetical protein
MQGFQQGQKAIHTVECIAATYLDKHSGTCQNQKDLNSKCETYECQNKYVCYIGVCHEWFSLPDGTIVEHFDLDYMSGSDGRDGLLLPYLCQSGEINNNGACSKNDYVDASDVDSEGFKPCNYNQLCNYTSGDSIKCRCGINSAGQGYCPRPGREVYNNIFNFW